MSCIPLPKFIREMENDTVEKIEGYVAMGTMFIKILMASFPMMFVPQLCDGDPCSMNDKIVGWNWLMITNFFTFFTFCNLYYAQGKREFYMIDYFDEDDEKSENYLAEEILDYPAIHKKILKLTKSPAKTVVSNVGSPVAVSVNGSLTNGGELSPPTVFPPTQATNTTCTSLKTSATN